MSAEDVARAAWSAAVGKRIASRTSPLNLVRDRLVVAVEDATWQRQLYQLRFQILSNLREILGDESVCDLELRVMPQKKPAKNASVLTGNPGHIDEADTIRDPVLRRIYKRSREKASA